MWQLRRRRRNVCGTRWLLFLQINVNYYYFFCFEWIVFENSRHSFAFYSEWMEEKPRASNETTTNKKIMEERARKRGKNPKRNYLIIINSGIITLASAVESDFEKNEEEKSETQFSSLFCGGAANERIRTDDRQRDGNLCLQKNCNHTLEWDTANVNAVELVSDHDHGDGHGDDDVEYKIITFNWTQLKSCNM